MPPSGRATPATQPVDHSNVGAAHSPEVLRQLAAGPDRPERPGQTAPGQAAPGQAAPGQAAPGQAAPGQAALPGARQGVDVASYQHPHGAAIDWAQAAAAGVQFAAVKATEGTYYRNPYALRDLVAAQAAGLSVAAYAFAVPNGNGGSKSPVAQADYLLRYLAHASGLPPPILLDIEYNPYGPWCYGLSQAAMVTWVWRFDAEVQARTGQDPLIYAPPQWWQRCTGGSPVFAQRPLWVPGYSGASQPTLSPGWQTWAFWQYSSGGTVPGIDDPGHTDLDQLNPQLVPLLDPGPRSGVTGAPARLSIRPADRVPGQHLTFTATGLPTGTAMNQAGAVTGAPREAGTYLATARATNSDGVSGWVQFRWRVRKARRTREHG